MHMLQRHTLAHSLRDYACFPSQGHQLPVVQLESRVAGQGIGGVILVSAVSSTVIQRQVGLVDLDCVTRDGLAALHSFQN